jgi:para-aminobenzoate synthetase/4-amino-4-deoxychorismate lyase
VAIRTLISGGNGTELGVGSGIVVDSDAESEWQEILVKSRFANFSLPDFMLIETMLWERESGFKFLKEHLGRAAISMGYFGWEFNSYEVNRVINTLEQQLIESASDLFRVRLLFDCKCTVSFQLSPLDSYGWNGSGVRLMISACRVNSNDLFLYHKTNKRDFYDSQYQECISAGFDEVIFFNESGTLTEGAISNIFIKYKGVWLTSPVDAGLLPGIWRNEMLKELGAEETSVSIEQLRLANEIIVGNSVRGGAVVTYIDFSGIKTC